MLVKESLQLVVDDWCNGWGYCEYYGDLCYQVLGLGIIEQVVDCGLVDYDVGFGGDFLYGVLELELFDICGECVID